MEWYLCEWLSLKPICKKNKIFFLLYQCLEPFIPFSFSTKRYYSTEFFRVFCRTLGACHTVNNSPILLKSSLLDSALSQLSGDKKEFIYLHQRPFYNCLSFMFMCALLKKQNLFSTYFLNGKWYWKNSNGFELLSIDSLSCKKWHKLNVKCLCTVKKIKN